MTTHIGLSTLTYDLEGSMRLPVRPDNDQANLSVSRRVTRTATLDGGAFVVDNGYSIADRTLTVRLSDPVDEAELLNLQRIFRMYSVVLLFTAEGAFNAAPSRLTINNRTVIGEFLVKSAGEVAL